MCTPMMSKAQIIWTGTKCYNPIAPKISVDCFHLERIAATSHNGEIITKSIQ